MFTALMVSAIAFAVPIALFLDRPLFGVILAFPRRGVETMVILDALLEANPGFLAACHLC